MTATQTLTDQQRYRLQHDGLAHDWFGKETRA